MKSELEIAAIAQVCHEANKAYCESMGDFTQTSWNIAPQWQRDSACSGVEYHLNTPNAKPEDSHNNWMKEKIEAGWVYGSIKNPSAKEHPCIVPYDKLPISQQLKDSLFIAIVHTLK